jgi:hypothetical protein
VAYPLGQLGNFFVYLFLVFAAYYYKVPLEGRDAALLPVMTLLSGFGSPTSAVNAVDFLSAWLSLPGGTRELYVELQTLTRYCQVIVSVMAFAFLSVLVTLAYYGKLRLQLPRLIAALVLPALAFVVIAWAGQGVHGYFLAPAGVRYGALTLDPAVTRGVAATVQRGAEPEPKGSLCWNLLLLSTLSFRTNPNEYLVFCVLHLHRSGFRAHPLLQYIDIVPFDELVKASRAACVDLPREGPDRLRAITLRRAWLSHLGMMPLEGFSK